MDSGEFTRRSALGPAALLARRAFAVVIGILTTITVPHFVPPRAYGIASMSMVLFGFAEMLKDAGLTSALMRKGEISPAEINFLFWFNVATTAILTCIIAIIAPAISSYYGEPQVTPVILISLLGFAAGGLAMQHRGLLSRDLRFTEIAIIDSVTTFLQFGITLGLAIAWRDVWALVVGPVIGSVISAVLNIVYSGWRPQRPRIIPEARAVAAFGLNSFAYSLSIFVSNNATVVLIARALGPVSLGQFNRASALMALPVRNAVEPMAEATMPVLARLRGTPDAYRTAYLNLLTRLNLIVLPTAILLGMAGPKLTAAFLGTEWSAAGTILQALAPALAAVGFGYAISDLFITQDRVGELRTLGLAEMIVRVAAVAGGIRYGVVPAALAFSVATLLVVCGRIVVAGRTGPVTVLDHARAALPACPVAAGVATGAAVALMGSAAYALSVFPTALAVLAASAFAGLAFGMAFPGSREALRTTAALLHVPGHKLFGHRGG